MNKLLILLTLIAGSTVNLVYSYEAHIINETDSTYKIEANVKGDSTQTWTIGPKEEIKKGTGIYCYERDGFKFKATDGKYKGQEEVFTSPLTGAGIGCKNFKAIIKPAASEFAVVKEE